MPEIKRLFATIRGVPMSWGKRKNTIPGMSEIKIRDLDSTGKPYREIEMTVEEYRELHPGYQQWVTTPAPIASAPVAPVPVISEPVASETMVSTPSPTVSEVQQVASDFLFSKIDEYLKERADHVSKQRLTAIQRTFDCIREYFGDVPMHSITRKDAKEFIKVLCTQPTIHNGSRTKKYIGKTLREISVIMLEQIKKNEEEKEKGNPYIDIPLLDPSTVNKYISDAYAFWDWCFIQDRNLPNHFAKQKLPEIGGKKREPFTVDHLNTIFHDPIFTEHEYTQNQIFYPHHYFVPLIGCYSGMRIEEICQMHLSDIKYLDNIWLFDLNREMGKKLKNDSSVRKVPIHSALITLGFLDYVQELRDEGETLLFPNLIGKPNEKTGNFSFSNAVTVWFGRLLKRLEIKTEFLVFHSFRHTFGNSYKQIFYEEPVYKELLGHAHEDMTKGTYSVAYYHQTLKTAIEALTLNIDMTQFVKPWVSENFLLAKTLRHLRRNANDPFLEIPRAELKAAAARFAKK
jgi:integrase